MLGDEPKKSRDIRRGTLMMAAVAAFLALTSCDSTPPGPYQPWKTDEHQEQKDRDRADRMWQSGYSGGSGGHIFGAGTYSGAHGVAEAGTARGGFGGIGAAHASAT